MVHRSLAHRPRLYWVSWELQESEGVEIYFGSDGRLPIIGQVVLKAQVDEAAFPEAGWKKKGDKPLPTFHNLETPDISRPSPVPSRRPAGLKDCNEEEVSRWKADQHRYPPLPIQSMPLLGRSPRESAASQRDGTGGNFRAPS